MSDKVVYPTLEMPKDPITWGKTDLRVDANDQTAVVPDSNLSLVPPPPEGKGRILIGIPLLDIKYEFFESFLKFWTQLSTAQNLPFEVGYQIAYRKPVHMAEEYLVNIALYNKCTHILLMDDDIYDVTVDDLLKLWNAKKDFISGVMYASKFPHAMCVFRRYDINRKVIDMPVDDSVYRLYEIPCLCSKCGNPISHWDAKFCLNCGAPQDNLIQPADLTPFPFTLIDLKVFDKIKKPWFHCTNNYPSDSWFADRMLEAGLREYAHMGVRLNHAGVSDTTKPYYMQMGMERAKTMGSVVNITPEDMEKHQTMLMNRMKETEQSIKEKPEIVYNGHRVANVNNNKPFTLITHGT